MLLILRRTHSDRQVADEVAKMHAVLLLGSSTRAIATNHMLQDMLHTSRHLSANVPKLPDPTDSATSSTDAATAASPAAADASNGRDDQLLSISRCIAAVDAAVTSHHDVAVCLAVWRQTVHLAMPTGKPFSPFASAWQFQPHLTQSTCCWQLPMTSTLLTTGMRMCQHRPT